jgi:hypothetical protein
MSALPPLASEVLRLLLLGPFQHEDDLAFHLHSRPARVAGTLHRLAEQHLIAALRPGFLGYPRRLWYLTPAGIRLLAGNPPPGELARFARAWRVDLAGLAGYIPRLPVIVTVQGMLKPALDAIHDALEATYAPRSYQEVTWYWVRDYRTTVRRAAHQYALHADGVVVYQATLDHPHAGTVPTLPVVRAVWMVLDPDVGTVVAILKRLEAFYRFRQQQERAGIAAVPPLWIVVPSAYRASLYRRAARHLERRLQVPSLPGIIQIAPPPAHGCWPLSCLRLRPPLPSGDRAWTRLDTGEESTLWACLVDPFPPTAIPPRILPFLPRTPVEGEETAMRATRRFAFAPLETRFQKARRAAGPLDTAQDLLRLARRQLAVLDLLATHPYIALDDLRTILDLSTVNALRVNYLSRLTQLDLVQLTRVPSAKLGPLNRDTSASATLCAALTERGWQLMSALYQLPKTRLSETKDAALLREHLITHGAHAMGVNRFFAWLIYAARSQRDGLHRLLWWETGDACIRRSANPATGEPISIRPDGIAEYAWGNRRVRLWLEWDMATMRLPQMAEKFRNYAAYAASQAYRDERPRTLPMVLVVVPTDHRERAISALLHTLVAQGHLAPNGPLTLRTTTFPLLAEHGPLAAIWWSQLPQALTASPRKLTFLEEVRPLPSPLPHVEALAP